MDKSEKTLRILINLIPDELRGPWKFDASNVGMGFTSEYGITNPEGASLGISVACATSFRQTWRSEQHMDDRKLGNTLAAYAASVSPAVIGKLLEEVVALRMHNQQYRESNQYLMDRVLANESKDTARSNPMNENRICAAYERLMEARNDYFVAAEASITARTDLDRSRMAALRDGLITGKNEAEREACARALLAVQYETLAGLEAIERQARHDLDQAQTWVEMERSLLRAAEIKTREVSYAIP